MTRLRRSTIAAFGAPALPLAIAGVPLSAYVPAHYSLALGLNLAAVGAMLALARVTDIVTDPLIGALSDRFVTPFGRRRPWLIAGAGVMMVGIFQLLLPPTNATLTYLLGWLTVTYIGWTMIEVPHRAWAAELASDHSERVRISGWRESWTMLGLAVAVAAPATASWAGASDSGSALRRLALAVLVVLPISVLVASLLTPEQPQARRPSAARFDLRGLARLGGNGAFVRVILMQFLLYLGFAATGTLSVIFIDDVVGPKGTFPVFYLIQYTVGFAAMPGWFWLSRRIGKVRSTLIAGIVFAMALGPAPLLPLHWPPCLFAMAAAKGLGYGGLIMLLPSLLADAVDLDAVQNGGAARGGLLFAIFAMASKAGIGVGALCATSLAQAAGFQAAHASAPQQYLAIALIYGSFAAAVVAAAMGLLWCYPLDRQRHGQVLLDLARLAASPAQGEVQPPLRTPA